MYGNILFRVTEYKSCRTHQTGNPHTLRLQNSRILSQNVTSFVSQHGSVTRDHNVQKVTWQGFVSPSNYRLSWNRLIIV